MLSLPCLHNYKAACLLKSLLDGAGEEEGQAGPAADSSAAVATADESERSGAEAASALAAPLSESPMGADVGPESGLSPPLQPSDLPQHLARLKARAQGICYLCFSGLCFLPS